MNQTVLDGRAAERQLPRILQRIGELFATLAAFAAFAAAADMPMPDDGNTRATSTVIAFGVRSEASLGANDDVDVFRIELQGRAEIAVQSGGNTDTVATLSDSEGEMIATNDDRSAANFNFHIVETLDGGVYYLTVTGANGDTGPYVVLARIQRAGDDHGDTTGSSTRITAAEVAGSLRPAGDIDAFRIDVSVETGAVLRTKGPTDTVGQLQDSAGNVVARADSGGDRSNFVIDTTLAPGIYYLLVSGRDGATGGYSVEAEFDAFAACANPGVRVPDSDIDPDLPHDSDDADSTDDSSDDDAVAVVYERFEALVVDVGSIELAVVFNSTGCIPVDNLNVLGTIYTVIRATWQMRAGASDDWTDVPGTATTGELCAYAPTDPGQYRLVGDVEVNGVLNHYSSNILTVE